MVDENGKAIMFFSLEEKGLACFIIGSLQSKGRTV